MNAVSLARAIITLVKKQEDKSGVGRALVPSSYVSGNPTLQLTGETSATLGSKTHKVLQTLGAGVQAPVPGESLVYARDSLGNRVILGRIVDLSAAGLLNNALLWNSLGWVEPGNTILISAVVQRSTSSANYVTLKRFRLLRPGRYRVVMELSNDDTGGAGATARLVEIFDGNGLGTAGATELVAAISGEVSSSGEFPTFSNATLDMTQTIPMGAIIGVQLKLTAGANAYIQNCVVKYTDATSALAVSNVAVTD